MREFPTITDPVFEQKRNSNLDTIFLKYINDERDLPFIYLCIKITFIIIPFAVFLFTSILTGYKWWIAGLIYAGLIVYFVGPYTLMLHNTSHRRLFKPKYKIWNNYIPWILAPFMGQSPETYFSHHIGMHHTENNLHSDKSSTMAYQRDSFIDFLKYGVGFLFTGIIELAQYFWNKKFMKLFNMVVRGETVYIIFLLLLAFINLKATLYIFVLSMVIVRLSMMAGNWGQHAFIDEKSPGNSYRNSITCINSAYNRQCFNDGYHIGHHINPSMHWTDMPGDFIKNKDKYAEEKAIVYEGLDFHMVWLFLMLKRYDILAKHMVRLDNAIQTDEQAIQMLKSRTKLIPA